VLTAWIANGAGSGHRQSLDVSRERRSTRLTWPELRVVQKSSLLGAVDLGGTFDVVSALRFNVVYEDAGDGWVYAHVPELPEVQTQGEGMEQARSMVMDAITLALDERRARGELPPEPGWAVVESVEIAA
jgi:predicted RNase H-like HicB family nuclease